MMLVLGIALFVSAAQKPSLPQTSTPISVSATGEAQALPDRVVVYFTLRGQGESSVEARQEVRRLLQQVTAKLAPLGIGRDMLKEEVSEVAPPYAARDRRRGRGHRYHPTSPFRGVSQLQLADAD